MKRVSFLNDGYLIVFPATERISGQKLAIYSSYGIDGEAASLEYYDDIPTSNTSNIIVSQTALARYSIEEANSAVEIRFYPGSLQKPLALIFTDGSTIVLNEETVYTGDLVFLTDGYGLAISSAEDYEGWNTSLYARATAEFADERALEAYDQASFYNVEEGGISSTWVIEGEEDPNTGDYIWEGYAYTEPSSLYYVTILQDDDAAYIGSFKLQTAPAPTPTQLSTPTGLSADQITKNSARVKWESVANASSYKVEYRQQGAQNWQQ